MFVGYYFFFLEVNFKYVNVCNFIKGKKLYFKFYDNKLVKYCVKI